MHVAVLKGKEKKTADLLDSTYFGPVYPEAPPFKNPQNDLFRIGVDEVSVMTGPKPQFSPKKRKNP